MLDNLLLETAEFLLSKIPSVCEHEPPTSPLLVVPRTLGIEGGTTETLLSATTFCNQIHKRLPGVLRREPVPMFNNRQQVVILAIVRPNIDLQEAAEYLPSERPFDVVLRPSGLSLRATWLHEAPPETSDLVYQHIRELPELQNYFQQHPPPRSVFSYVVAPYYCTRCDRYVPEITCLYLIVRYAGLSDVTQVSQRDLRRACEERGIRVVEVEGV